MSTPTNGNAPWLAGERGAESTNHADFAADIADNAAERQPIKPEVDLASWHALGGKPSRDRHLKRGWKRRAAP